MQEGKIISKKEFMQGASYAKEEYEGLLVCADPEHGGYSFGVQLDENRVLVVDHSKDNQVHEKLDKWVPQITEIQRSHNAQPDSQNYTR